MKNKKGFTLIELLVVVAIIGLLSAVVLVSLSSARRSANDARRKADLKQIVNAMAMVYDAKFAIYPTVSGGGDVCSVTSGVVASCISKWAVGTAANQIDIGTWLAILPDDPVNNATYYYRFKTTGNDQRFCVIANLQTGGYGYYAAYNGAGTMTPGTTCP